MNAKFLAVALTLSVLFVTANESCACNPPDPDPPPSGNDSPIADLTTDWGYVILGRSVTLDGSASYDPDGSGGINNSGITKFEWDFTNNSSYDYYETPGYYPDGAPDGITTHLYNQPNTFTVKLRVTDSDDATDTGTCTVNVSEDSDNDDLPDGWETYYFGAPDVNDDNDDFDGDGYNNIIEYLHGTDPSNPADPDGSPPPTTIRVPDNIDSIQRAINGSINGDTIVVSQGRYYENIDLNGKKITLTSTSPNNPDVVAATIIDANGLGPVVTFGPSEETDSALRGLTITGADDPDTEHYGGIYCSHSSAQITNCVIYGNTSKWKDGGGIYMEDSSAQITNCVIYENACKDGGSGGGIYIDCSSLLVKNCIFSDNEGGGAGGGIYISSGDLSITVESCAFLGNEADKGGGICDTSGHTSVPVTIKNCVFIGNIAIAQAQSHEGKGGAIYNEGLAGCCKVVDIYNCTFLENTAEAENSSIGGKGGAICNYPKDWQESATLIVNIYNCILWGNQAIQDGGGPICGHDIYNSYSDTTLNFCNFEENADDYLYHKGSDPGAIEPNEENCIFGDGSNPLFVNSNNPAGPDDVFGTSDDGLRLQPNSPCVDAGIDAAVDGNVPETGIFGQERVDIPYGDGTSITDIGAYETPIDRMYVNENATFNPDASGLFWDDAFVYLQDALKQAKDFDFAGEIWVAAGTYYPDRNKDNTEGTDDRNSSFELINGVKLYGGFTGNEIYLHRRSWIVNETILSGDINEPGDSNDNSLHVVVGADSAILDGFTITGGNANGSGSNGWGGGIFCFYVSPTISNCTITENTGEDSSGGMFNGVSNSTVTNCTITNNSGGGMLNAESSPTISNCTIAKNTNKSDGGGIYNVESSPIISNCTITENTSYYSGGGIYNDESNPTLTNCTFSGNTANNSGGGMYHYGGTLELTNCTFSGNSAGGKGGGLYNSMCSLTMTNCTFSDNFAEDDGGGMCHLNDNIATLTNCTFSGNRAVISSGGGMYNGGSYTTLTNCTFSGNAANNCGGGMYNYEQRSPTLANCIFWGNSDGGGSDEPAQIFGGSPVVNYCCIQGLTGNLGGQGNLDVNPNFVDANNPTGPDGIFGTDDDGLRLRVFDTRHGNLQKPFNGSCIDSADDTVAPDKDVTGRGRRDVPYIPNNGKGSIDYTDMGAYEAPMVWYVDSTNSNSMGRGWSWNFVLVDLQEAIKKAEPNDEIWVAAGEYKPGSERSDTFHLDEDKAIAIYGGFNGTEYGRHERNWKANETILSGNIGDIIDDNGDIVYTDNCYHIVKIDCDDIILDGFTITGGYIDSGVTDPCGAGVYLNNSSPKIANCIIRDNYTHLCGHGMYVNGGSPTVTNCIFYDNRKKKNIPNGCLGHGGGMYNKDASPTVTDCIFIGNWAEEGAGMYNNNSSPTVMNCIFRGNAARYIGDGLGGGIANRYNSSAIVTNCIFNSNYARSRGGGVYNRHSCLILSNCTFIWNRAYKPGDYGGGGAYLCGGDYDGDLTEEITNSIFWDNYGENNANQIAISGSGSPPIIQYCDIQGGYEEGEGNIDSYPDFIDEPEFYDKTIEDGTDNTIKVVDASIYTFGDIIKYGDDDISRTVTKVDYDSNIVTFSPQLEPIRPTEQSTEIKNWGVYAIIRNESYNDFKIEGKIARLKPDSSPCIDKGLDEGLPRDTTDIDGDGDTIEKIPYDIIGVPRIQKIAQNENSVDMGAFESGGLIAKDKSVQTAEDTEKLFDLDDNDMYDLKEGDFLTYVVITWPKHGILSKTSDIGVSYMPDPEYHGLDEFCYRAYDGKNYSETAKVDITVTSVDDEPVAVDDSVWINPEVSEITIGVLANDYDVDPGCNIYIKSITQPSHGIAANNEDGTIKYTPYDPYSLPETDTFTYDIEDSNDSSPVTDTATVTVKLNHKPVATDDSAETELNIIVIIDVLANDSDPDGHSLEIAEIVEQPTKGQVKIYSYYSEQEEGEVLVYMPDSESTEGYQTSFTYKVRDEFGLESQNSATVTITVKDSTTISDSDEDTVSDEDEIDFFGTHPYKPDADGDGVDDGDEIMGGSDPTNPHSADYYDDPLPYITCFQINQGYTPNKTLDHQKGWKVDGDCYVRYKFLRSFNLVPPWYCMYANISAGGSTISKEFDDKGEADDLSNIIRVKLYPAAGAMVKVYSGDTVIAGVKFEEVDDNRTIQFLEGEETWVDSGKSWERYSYGKYWVHNYAMLLKFELSFETSHQYSIYWDAESDSDRYLTQSDDEVVTNHSFPGGIESITRIEFTSGIEEDFGVRALYINEEETVNCYMASPSPGDDVKESRVPVKGWACSVNMSGYALEWYAPHLNYYSEKFDEGQMAMNEVAEGEEHNILGYWNTGALPNSIYHVGLRIYQDMITNWGDGVEPISLWDFYIDWGVGIDYCGVSNVATSGSVVSTTFHYVEEPDISVPWPGQFPFELRRIYDSGRCFIRYPFFPGWTNNNQIILVEDAAYYESSECEETVKGDIADEDASGLAFGAVYVQYEDGSMRLFRHTTGSVSDNVAIYTPYPDNGSGDYIKRTTDGAVPSNTGDCEGNQCYQPTQYDLQVKYELDLADGTKIVFDDINEPRVVLIPDNYTDTYPNVPTGGAVYKQITCEYCCYDPPGDKWRFVTAVKTKSDRFGNTLEFEWNEWNSKEYYRLANTRVPSVHKVSYNPGDGGATISIELKKSHPGNWNYDYAELKVDGGVERTVYYNLEYTKWDAWGQRKLVEVSTKNNEEIEKDYTSYEYWYDTGYLVGIFNDKLVEDGSSCYSSPLSASSTWVYYIAGNFTQRRDFVDEDNYLTRYYWWFFFEPDSGNDEDGQCVFNAVDFYRPTDLAPYRMDVAIKNEKGQLRAKLTSPIGALSKLITYDYETDPNEPLYDLPFTPKEIREYWHDYDCYSNDPNNDLVEVGRIIVNDYVQERSLDFGTDNPSVDIWDLNSQSVYYMGYDDTSGDLDDNVYPDNLVSFSETDYHDYASYNLQTDRTSYQKLDRQEQPQHEKPVETEYVYGDHLGNTEGLTDAEKKYLVQEWVLIDENGPGAEDDEVAITYYEYNHRTCDGPDGLPDTDDDAYALTRKIDHSGAVTLYEYDDNHFKQWVNVGPEGGEMPVERYCHDAIGQMLLKADTYGIVTLYDYDGFGDVVKVRTYYDPDALDENERASFTPEYYEANMSPRSTAIYDYDGQRRGIFEKTFPEEKGADQVAVKETEYTAGSDQPRKMMFYKSQSDYDSGTYDSLVEYLYDGRGLKIREENCDVTADLWWRKNYCYDSMDRLIETIWWDYEDKSELKAVCSLYHGSGKKAYEEIWGADSKEWWELQRRTDYKYDVLDRLKDNIVTYDFDDEGLPERTTTSYAYDDVGNQISVTDPKLNIIYTDYDNANRKIVEYFADDGGAGRNAGLIKRETGYYANNLIKDVKSYDYGDVELEQKGTLSAHSEFDYDERGRVKTVTEAIDQSNEAVTTYEYQDAKDNIDEGENFDVYEDDVRKKYANVKITDAEDEVTRTAYNERGKTAKTLFPSGDYEQLVYNGDGTSKKKAVWVRDDEQGADPKWIEYDYDEFARLKKTKYPPDNETYYIEYFYDGFGRKTQVTDNRDANDNIGGTGGYANKISYKYDPLDQITDVNDQDGYHIKYSYRSDGQKQTITVAEPDNPDNTIYAVEYGYDIAGRITHVNEPVLEFGYQSIASFDYDDNGNRKQIKYFLTGQETGPTVSTDYDYNPDNLLTYFSTTGGPSFSFDAIGTGDVDGLGRLRSADETLTKTDGNPVTYTLDDAYDMLSQLTDATITNIDGSDWTAEYTYHENGDMASRTITGTDNTTFSYAGNQMAGASGGETFSLDWDLNGNMKDLPYSGVTELTYNWDNKLRSGQKDANSISIRYDPLGNRIWKDSSQAGQRKYIVDIVGDLPVILLELNPSNGSVLKTYIYTNSQIIAQHDGKYDTDRYFYLHDRLGSVRQIIDTDGYVVNRYTFNPFGKGFGVEREQTIDNPFKFTGQYHDGEVCQYYLRARQYHPHIGRFTTRDPVAGKFEEPLSLHKYLYCQNEPINRIDPFGLVFTVLGAGNYYDILETQKVINAATEIVAEHWWYGPRKAFSDPGDFDYKYEPYIFTLSGFYGKQFARGSEFGNYLAGYTCDYNYWWHGINFGEAGARIYGHRYAFGDLALTPFFGAEATGYTRSKLLAPLVGAVTMAGIGGLVADDYGSRYWITKGVLDSHLTQMGSGERGGPIDTIRAFQLKIFQDYYYGMHFVEQMMDNW